MLAFPRWLSAKLARSSEAPNSALLALLDDDTLSTILIHVIKADDALSPLDCLRPLAALAQTCRALAAKMSRDSLLWKTICCDAFPVCAVFPDVTDWRNLYRLRMGPPSALALADQPSPSSSRSSIPLDEVSLIVEIAPTSGLDRARVMKLEHKLGPKVVCTIDGTLCLCLRLSETYHKCGGSRCGLFAWEVPELQCLHACEHCHPEVTTMALWHAPSQTICYMGFNGRGASMTSIESSLDEDEGGQLLKKRYTLDLAPRFESMSRILQRCVSATLTLDFPYMDTHLLFQCHTLGPRGGSPVNGSVVSVRDLPEFLSTLPWFSAPLCEEECRRARASPCLMAETIKGPTVVVVSGEATSDAGDGDEDNEDEDEDEDDDEEDEGDEDEDDEDEDDDDADEDEDDDHHYP